LDVSLRMAIDRIQRTYGTHEESAEPPARGLTRLTQTPNTHNQPTYERRTLD